MPEGGTGWTQRSSAIHGRYADDLVDADHGFAPRFVDFAGEVAAVVRSELGANGGGE